MYNIPLIRFFWDQPKDIENQKDKEEEFHKEMNQQMKITKDEVNYIEDEVRGLKLELNEFEEKLEKQSSLGMSPKTLGSPKSIDYDFDYLVYNDDTETDDEEENEDGIIIQKWSKTKKYRLQKCLWKLKYNRVISTFYLDRLRRREIKWSWMIIVISTFTSGITVANNVEDEPFDQYDTIINILLTVTSMTTSLIAAWIKKQGFVEKINEIDKYLISINSLCEELEIQFVLLDKDRLPYKEFKEKFVPEITKYVSSNPMIPPKEWKKCAKEITLKYPQLIEPDNNEENKLWPWFGDLIQIEDPNGEPRFIRRPTKFMNHMLKKDTRSRLMSSCCFDIQDRFSVYK